MNILLLCTHLNPGGISRYILNLSYGLSGAGDKVFVASCGGPWERKLSKRCEFVRIPIHTKSIFSIKVLICLPKIIFLIKRNNIDIIHANTRVTQFLAALASLLCGVPYVSTFHGFYSGCLRRKFLKLGGAKAIAVSSSVKEYLTGRLGFKSGDVYVVYNGIFFSEFNGINRPESLSLKDLELGIFSRLSKEKEVERAILLLPEVLRVYPGIKLIIAGEGRQKSYLKNLSEEKNLSASIEFIGIAEPVDFFKGIDILLFPSSSEGLGFSVLEAKAAGCVVIASSAGGLTEIIKDNYDGFLLKDFNASSIIGVLKKLISRSSIYRDIVLNARRAAKSLSVESMAHNTRNVYAEAIEVGRGR